MPLALWPEKYSGGLGYFLLRYGREARDLVFSMTASSSVVRMEGSVRGFEFVGRSYFFTSAVVLRSIGLFNSGVLPLGCGLLLNIRSVFSEHRRLDRTSGAIVQLIPPDWRMLQRPRPRSPKSPDSLHKMDRLDVYSFLTAASF